MGRRGRDYAGCCDDTSARCRRYGRNSHGTLCHPSPSVPGSTGRCRAYSRNSAAVGRTDAGACAATDRFGASRGFCRTSNSR